jgi:hypothetical protein
MLTRLAQGAALLLALGLGPAAAQQSADPRLAEAMSYCLDSYPNLGRAMQQARSAGFRSEGWVGGFDLYTAYRQQLLVGFDRGSEPVCLFGLDGLRDQEAIDAASAALSAKFGSALVRLGPSPDGAFIEGWVAETGGTGILVGVHRQTTIGNFWRGSMITVQPYQPAP